ncbi:CYCLIN-DEPENDENT KINASE G-2-LIKE [Salix viminalis]|uniref:cyclin-dependent kinase n=1 Tax=Salix viminalis TaxID=40686 RepID=A0A9Q0Z4Y0_SALVM|nr:CYCLIN-DEPENDENT KINASE G-2-LIKE [Salix viminalis]KAJ6721618.1 CYCLIN-DEPENDENT KINASE G-2-LIKE [Salix viminalis]KAJ6721619.1 CYCLIN-DEPENDENT KINASE G-2-LIKE [Salix viminalis]
MAAGRHGGYHDNEFKDRDSDFELLKEDFAYSEDKYDRIENGNAANDRGQVRYLRDRARIRQKDIKEMGMPNGGYRSSSSRSDSGSSGSGSALRPRRCGFSVRATDKEPGELSSESGSDDAIDPESHAHKDSEVMKVTPVKKKRKFSPVVWDRDDKAASNLSKSWSSPAATTLPPPPPLPKAYRQSPNVIPDGGVEISPVTSSQNLTLQSSSLLTCVVVKGSANNSASNSPAELAFSLKGSVVKGPVGNSASNSPVELAFSLKGSVVKGSTGNSASESSIELVSSPVEDQWGNDQEARHIEDEDYVPMRNISSSRWADGNNSPVDEGEIVEDQEVPKRRKKMPQLESLDSRVRNKSSMSDPGDLKREGSDAARGRSSEESDERGTHARSSIGDDYPGDDSGRDDYMEVDEEHNKNDSDTDPEDEDENDLCEAPEPAGPPQRCINMLQGCRSVDEFERLNKIDEGTYGVVYRARDKKTGEIVALKKVKMEKEREGFPLTSLREINILLSFHHPSIVDVKEVVVGSNLDSIFMVMEYMEHDLKGLMESMRQPFSQSEVKCLMLQLLEGTKYLHDNWVLHRDLKTSNLLLNNRGELKICDFGLARQYGSPLKPYTHLVVTLWYRAPELLLGAKQYSTAIDMWSLGCIMAELLSKEPLFNGKTEVDQLDKIFRILGTPNETIWPGFSKLPGVKVNFVKHQYNLLRKKFPATSFTGSPVLSDSGFDLLNKLLTYDPEKRITAEAALNHDWFREVPLPKSKDFMPTFPAQHAQDRRLRRIMKSPDPLEEQRRKELQQGGELGTGGLFG